MAAQRWSVVSRVLAAVIGGYVATGLTTVAVSRWLPLSRAEATHAATLLSFVIYVAIVLAAFHIATAARAWLMIAAISGCALFSLYAADGIA
jgi:hypothetical protein